MRCSTERKTMAKRAVSLRRVKYSFNDLFKGKNTCFNTFLKIKMEKLVKRGKNRDDRSRTPNMEYNTSGYTCPGKLS